MGKETYTRVGSEVKEWGVWRESGEWDVRGDWYESRNLGYWGVW